MWSIAIAIVAVVIASQGRQIIHPSPTYCVSVSNDCDEQPPVQEPEPDTE
jgi:hypothetical protein